MRLWMRISNLSHVLVPLPQGDLRVVIRRTLVGSRMGPLTFSSSALALRRSSAETMCCCCVSWYGRRNVEIERVGM